MTGVQLEPAVTLLVPTMNRPEFVARLLAYYDGQGFPGRIAIGDSSTPELFGRTAQAIQGFAGRLNISHVEAAGLTIGPCLKRLVDLAGTAYAVVVPDDDFIVPAALDRCIAFLADHPDYVAAHGAGITMTLDTNGLHGRVVYCAPYPQTLLEAASASQRLTDHLSQYTVSLFSVHRIESWRVMLRDVESLPDMSFSAELLPCCLSVVLGKVRQLDGLYLVRQSHAARLELPTMFDWIVTPVWYPSYHAVVESLAQALVERDACSLDAARKTVKEGFRHYVGLGLGLRRNMGRDAWVLDLARRVWRAVQYVRPTPEAEWSLPALLRPSSPHHAAFLPIYNALVTPPEASGAHRPAQGAAGPPAAHGLDYGKGHDGVRPGKHDVG